MSETLVLFFHEQSNACIKLREIMAKNKDKLKDVKIQYADVSQINPPKEITSIPALLVNGKEVLIGKKVFDYFTQEEEMEYLPMSGFKNSGSTFSNIDDDGDVGNHSGFSNIDAPNISDGIPEYSEDKGAELSLDKLQAEREIDFKNLTKE